MLSRPFLTFIALSIFATSTLAEENSRPIAAELGGLSVLLNNVDVQEELDLSAEQIKFASDTRSKTLQRKREYFVQLYRSLNQFKPAQRNDKFREGMKELVKLDHYANQQMLGKLSSSQSKRVMEICWQLTGVQALARSEVAQKIELTSGQQDKVIEILARTRRGGNAKQLSEEERKKRFKEVAKLNRAERADLAKKRREERDKDDAEILTLLTSRQLDQWNEMQGAKFERPTQVADSSGKRSVGDAFEDAE